MCGRAACDSKRRWAGLVQHPDLAALDQAAVRGTGGVTWEGSGGEMLPRLTEGGDNSRAPLQKVGRKRKAVHTDHATPLETSPTQTGYPDSVGSQRGSRSTLSPTPASSYNHDDTTMSLPLATAAQQHATATVGTRDGSESVEDKPTSDPVGEAPSANNTTPSYTLPPPGPMEFVLPHPSLIRQIDRQHPTDVHPILLPLGPSPPRSLAQGLLAHPKPVSPKTLGSMHCLPIYRVRKHDVGIVRLLQCSPKQTAKRLTRRAIP